MSRIQEVVEAQIFMPNGESSKRQLQMLVYREGCDGNASVLTIQQQELVELLNRESM